MLFLMVLLLGAGVFSACGKNAPCRHRELEHYDSVAATCEHGGNVEYWKCTQCGQCFSDAAAKNVLPSVSTPEAHEWGAWVNVHPLTCTTDSLDYHTCILCGKREERVKIATGHTFGDWQTVKTATCTESGEQVRVCAACGKQEQAVSPALGHIFGDRQTVKTATCTEYGLETQTCTVCGEEAQRWIFPTGHKGTWQVLSEPTCAAEGVVVCSCTVCGETIEDAMLSRLPHSCAAWETRREATCTREGEQVRACTVCGEIAERRSVPATGHEWNAARDAECILCGEHLGYTAGLIFNKMFVGKYYVTDYTGEGTDVLIPAKKDGLPVTDIYMRALEGAKIERVSFAEGSPLCSIGDYAFSGSTLKEIALPEGLEWIGYGAFAGCTALQQISLPEGLGSIRGDTFAGCTALQQISLPEGLTAIWGGAFAGCTALQQISLPEELNALGGGAFEGCTSLQSVMLPASLGVVGERVFARSGVRRVEFAMNSEFPIITSAFFFGSALEEIVIPACITSIYADAFGECSALRRVVFINAEGWSSGPASWTHPDISVRQAISSEVFLDPVRAAAALTQTYVSQYLIREDGHTFGAWNVSVPADCLHEGHRSRTCAVCGGREEEIIPKAHVFGEWQTVRAATCTQDGERERACSVCGEKETSDIPARHSWNAEAYSKCTVCGEELGYTAGLEFRLSGDEYSVFRYSGSSPDVIVPAFYEGLPVVGVGAFAFMGATSSTQIRSVRLPEGIKKIEEDAFMGCLMLESVSLPASLESIGFGAFYGCKALKSVTFAAPDGWSVSGHSFTAEELAVPERAAAYLVDIWREYFWHRTP